MGRYIVFAVFLGLIFMPYTALAMVSGPCYKCHAMHFSQSPWPTGWQSEGPNDYLLVKKGGGGHCSPCVSCHSSETSSTYEDLGGGLKVPIVFYFGASAPTEYLAGGNFWWVKEGLGGNDTKGHNVFEDEDDEALSAGAPGGFTCGTNSCHNNLSKKFGDPQLPGQLVSIGMLSTVFVGPLIGVLSDRMKKRTPFVLLISIAGSVSILGLMFPSKIVAAAAGVLVVASAFCFLTPYSALISDYSPQNKKDRNFGIVTGVVNITTFLASIFINVTYESNSQLTFFVLSMVVLLSVIPLLLYVRKEPPASANIAEKEWQKEKGILLFLKKHPLFLICLFIQFGFWFSFGGLIPYLTSFLNAELSMGLGSAAMWVGALTLNIPSRNSTPAL